MIIGIASLRMVRLIVLLCRISVQISAIWTGKHSDHYQCAQIWQNFATLAKKLSLKQFDEWLFNIWQS